MATQGCRFKMYIFNINYWNWKDFIHFAFLDSIDNPRNISILNVIFLEKLIKNLIFQYPNTLTLGGGGYCIQYPYNCERKCKFECSTLRNYKPNQGKSKLKSSWNSIEKKINSVLPNIGKE